MKKGLIVVSTLLCGVITAGLMATPVLASNQENPDKAVLEYSGLTLFRYYSDTLDALIMKNGEHVVLQLDNMPYANLPPGLTITTETFSESMKDCSKLVISLESDINNLRMLILQSRLSETTSAAAAIDTDLKTGHQDVQKARNAFITTGVNFSVLSQETDSPLRISYEEVLTKLDAINSILDTYGLLFDDQENALSSILTSGELRKTTILTLQLDTPTAFVGDTINVSGLLTAEGKPLEGQAIDIQLHGVTAASAVTDATGAYLTALTIPYDYTPAMTVRSSFFPRDTLYLASLSPTVNLDVQFYEMVATMAMPDKAYPGRNLTVSGRWNYTIAGEAIERDFELFLDNTLISLFTTTDNFNRQILLPAGLAQGTHRLTLSAKADLRYAPVSIEKPLNVIKAPAQLIFSLPGIILKPGEFEIRGSVTSETGTLQNAQARVAYSGQNFTFTTATDGSFHGTVKADYSFSLLGSEELSVNIVPGEPWNSGTVSSRKVFVINVINCGAFLVVLIVLGILLPRRLRFRLHMPVWRRHQMQPHSLPPDTQPVPVYSDITRDLPRIDSTDDPKSKVFSLYIALLKLVGKVTSLVFKPQDTLRESVNGTRKILGPATDRLLEFTLLVERLLYSHSPASDKELADGEKLASKVRDGLKK